MKRRVSKRKSVTIPDEKWEAIIDLQHRARLISQAEALRRVIDAGLEALAESGRETSVAHDPGTGRPRR